MEVTAEQVLARLKEGNTRFVRGENRTTYSPEQRNAVAAEPRPMAVIIGCSDSRVPPEAVFDLGVGDAFVVRSAGQVLSEAGLVSVRFGVELWGIPLVVVLGHEDCEAVRTAVAGDAPTWLHAITDFIDGAPESAALLGDDVRARSVEAVDEHVHASVAAIATYLGSLAVERDAPLVIGGTYSLSTGKVRWLDCSRFPKPSSS